MEQAQRTRQLDEVGGNQDKTANTGPWFVPVVLVSLAEGGG
jgi:hypothetical protein